MFFAVLAEAQRAREFELHARSARGASATEVHDFLGLFKFVSVVNVGNLFLCSFYIFYALRVV